MPDASLGSGGACTTGSGGASPAGIGTGSGGVLSVQGTRPPDTCPDDMDGLSPAEEAAAGTDPCEADTDHDGCIDGAQVKLGGCGDLRNAVLASRCYSGSPSAVLTFTAPPSDAGVWPALGLRQSAASRTFGALTIVASPSPSFRASGATCHDVPGGVSMEFVLTVPVPDLEAADLFEVELYAGSADASAPRVVDHGKVLLVGGRCAIPL